MLSNLALGVSFEPERVSVQIEWIRSLHESVLLAVARNRALLSVAR